MQTSAHPQPHHFLHLLQREAQGDYPLAGRAWIGHSYPHGDCLSLHESTHPLGYVILEIRSANDGYQWEWSCKLADAVYARHFGTTETPELAAAAALAYEPKVARDEMSGHPWLELTPDRWFTHFDGQAAEVRKDVFGDGYSWMRTFPAAAPIAALISYAPPELRGKAELAELAMLAAEHAPADLRRACMAFVVATRPASDINEA